MAGVQQPFLYDQEKYNNDARFPPTTFDPKAFTRASWEVKAPKPKPTGPLVSFNQHPDTHGASNPRRRYRQLGPRTKNWIRRMRVVQLALRAVQLVAALGVLALMILITNVDVLVAWVMRITAGVVVIHCIYGIYHLQRPAGGRSPASSASYMLFASISDICIMPIYTYGVMSVSSGREAWTTLVASQELMRYFVPALYWTLVAAAGLHFVSLVISAWLGIKFRQISMMPPDMNPLEPHLTSRVSAGRRRSRHKRNKSSVATSASSSSLADPNRHSGLPAYDDLARPASISFAQTRRDSEASQQSPRDSRVNLPSRQYQITPGNSPRSSMNSTQLRNAMAGGGAQEPSSPHPASRHSYHQSMAYQPALQSQSPASARPLSHHQDQQARGTYTEVALDESSAGKPPRSAKFTETWYTSDSLINRTQQRNRAVNNLVRAAATCNSNGNGSRPYSAVSQRRDLGRDDDVSDDNSEDEDNYGTSGPGGGLYDDASRRPPRSRASPSQMAPEAGEAGGDENDLAGSGAGPMPPRHQHPLRSNPTSPASAPRPKRSADERYANIGQDIADLQMSTPPAASGRRAPAAAVTDDEDDHGSLAYGKKRSSTPGRSISKRLSWGGGGILSPRQRDSSIQPESSFSYSKPYGQLRPATPPIMVATAGVGSVASPGPAAAASSTPRQISSGNDFYDLGSGGRFANRRNVSGKVAEEGRSRYELRDRD